MVRIDIAALRGAAFAAVAQCQSYPISANASLAGASYKDPTLPVETRVQDLLSRMTLDEKVAQLMQGIIVSPSHVPSE